MTPTAFHVPPTAQRAHETMDLRRAIEAYKRKQKDVFAGIPYYEPAAASLAPCKSGAAGGKRLRRTLRVNMR